MGNKSTSSLIEASTLEKFQKDETPRKMKLHILSDNKQDCISLVKYFTNEKFPESSDELLEKDIKDKINLYSFMDYKVYNEPNSMMKKIKELSQFISKFPNSKKVFSEVILILNNEKIIEQIATIKDEIENDDILSNKNYFIPFIIIISPNDLDLKGFIPLKTFQYKISLKDILSFDPMKKNENNLVISQFFKRINVLFSYYNELGDTFAFKNSKGENIEIIIEEPPDNPAFINVLLLGRSGSGKSTFVNLILNEKKSIEGGTGISTTSKNLLIYRKKDVPIRFYDVKGIENEETVKNYVKIMTEHNINNDGAKDPINAIFYLMQYKKGTIVEEMENKLFEELIEFNIPILFIITKTPYDPDKKSKNKKTEKSRENDRNQIINVVKSLIFNSFGKKNKSHEAENFINNYVKFYFVNLLRDESAELPPFGIDKVLSFFTQSVSQQDWEKLEYSCFKNEEENCKLLCQNNPFLHYYSDFDKLNTRNKNEALEYLKGLKAGAFFSGWVPGLDIGMEYYYRYKFTEKLKNLYGFDLDKAKNFVKEDVTDEKNNQKSESSDENDEESTLTEEDFEKRKSNIKLEQSNIDIEVDQQINNKGRNAGGAITRGVLEVGGVVIKALPTAGQVAVEAGAVVARGVITTGLKVASWVLLPVTCIAFGTWSCVNVHKDCMKILDIYDKAFTPLKFDTLYAYIKSYKNAINYLEFIGKKIIEDDKKENEENE